jgi:hypothetical protein
VTWSTPSGRRFVETLHDELAAGMNAVCCLPKPLLDESLTWQLSDLLAFHGRNRLVVATVAPSGGDAAPAGLLDLLKAHWDWAEEGLSEDDLGSSSLELFFNAASAGDDRLKYLALAGLEGLPAEVQRGVARDLPRWSALVQQSKRQGRPQTGLRLLVMVTPLFPAVKSELFLSVHHWWAMTSDIDHLTAFNELARLDNLEAEPVAELWWLKSLCQGLCHDDVALMRLLISRKPKTAEELAAALAAHPLHEAGRRLQSKAARAPARPPLRLGSRPPIPPNGLDRELWAEGLLFCDPEISPHPVLMDGDQLRQAINRGQVRVLLPLVAQMRSLLQETIERIFGTGVWMIHVPDEGRRQDLWSEINPLAYFVRDGLPASSRYTAATRRTTSEFAFAWREIRNTVAHYKMLPYEVLEEGFRLYRNFHDLAVRLHREDAG